MKEGKEYEEARGGFSKEDFIYKINTAFKEARETNIWLRLLKDSKILKDEQIKEILLLTSHFLVWRMKNERYIS